MIVDIIKKALLLDIFKGLIVTLKFYFSPKLTVQFPERVKEPRERFRGILRLYRDETGTTLCIACKACQRACPEFCFDIEGQKDGSGKMRPVKFDWRLERCTFCGLCVEVCPTDAIRFSHEFRLSTTDRSRLFFRHEEMYEDYDLAGHLRRIDEEER